ncbi:MAG: sensor domain-containing diguanylate cyclase [Bacteroidetes bacterium]|nr:sensor domain-containing diguanylate cyclase [Bacteroidota bacterium]MBU2584574.1 sensor domain-containing diguanylate cyclase [Bacteroidota bacterium]
MAKLNKRRLITFILLIILGSVPLLTEDLFFRIAAIAVLVVYVAFIIFLRDGKTKDPEESSEKSSVPTGLKPELDSYTEEEEKSIITSTELKRMKQTTPIHSLKPSNLKDKFYEIACESLPEGLDQDAQFNFVLEKILNVVYSTLIAHSAIFFWYNKKKNQMIIQSYVSENNNIHKARFSLEDDIVSKVVRNGAPELLNNLNSNVESDLIRYYDTAVGIRSIVAVPVFINDQLIGVLVADSKSEDAFGVETVYLLGRFVRMITIMLGIFDEKFSVNLVNQKLDAVIGLIGDSEKNQDEKYYYQKLLLAFDKLIEWDALSIISFDHQERSYKLKKVVQKTSLKYPGEGLIVDLDKSITGKAIQTGRSVKIDDVTEDKFPLFNTQDSLTLGGSLLITPIVYQNKTFGAIVFEKLRKNSYTNKDVRFIEKIASYIASHFDAAANIRLLNSYLSVDLDTLLLNRTTFEKRVKEELTKSNITKVNVGLAFMSIDNFEKLLNEYGEKVIQKIVKHVAVHLNKESDDLMINARLDTNKFAVLFFNRDDAEAFLWCEKLRQKFVKDFINLDNSNISISLSIGFASGRNHVQHELLFENCELVLRRAISSGGNCVRNFK